MRINNLQHERGTNIGKAYSWHSPDSLAPLREKMNAYITNGCRLAWLVDPSKQQTMVHHPDGSVEVIPFSEKLGSGEVLPGFEILMKEVIKA